MRIRLRPFLRNLMGRNPAFPADVAVESVTLGSEDCSHCVALRGLDSTSIVYSFGVGEDASFDLALIGRLGLTVHAFDPTPRSLAWVQRHRMPAQFVMHGVGIADHDGTARFWAPADPRHVSHSVLERGRGEGAAIEVEVRRLHTLMGELGHARLDVLKMDVEGAEYGVIEDVTTSRIPVDQVLVEFHHHLPNVPFVRTRRAVEVLRSSGYRIFSVSGSGLEYSFIHERLLANG